MNPSEKGKGATPLERAMGAAGEGAPSSVFLGSMKGTLLEALQIEVREATPERVVATMPVGPAQSQPYGLLHGGASVALAESVASIGAALVPGGGLQRVVGIEINANHIRAVSAGSVTAVGTPLHRGRSTHVWSIEISDDEGRTVCVSRCTVAVLG